MIKYNEYNEKYSKLIRKSNVLYLYNQCVCVCLWSDKLHRRRLRLSLRQSDCDDRVTDPCVGCPDISDQTVRIATTSGLFTIYRVLQLLFLEMVHFIGSYENVIIGRYTLIYFCTYTFVRGNFHTYYWEFRIFEILYFIINNSVLGVHVYINIILS